MTELASVVGHSMAGPDISQEGDAKGRRSRTGCLTCRKRKKRCDESHPICGACDRLRLDCHYPLPGQERRNKRRSSILDRSDNVPRGSDGGRIIKPHLTDDHIHIRGSHELIRKLEDDNDELFHKSRLPLSHEGGSRMSDLEDSGSDHSSTSSADGRTHIPESVPFSIEHHLEGILPNGTGRTPPHFADFGFSSAPRLEEIVDEAQPLHAMPETGSDLLMDQTIPAHIDASVFDTRKQPDESVVEVSSSNHVTTFASPPSFAGFEFVDNLANLSPEISMLPPALPSWTSVRLDSEGLGLFEYFCNHQASLICVAPVNSFLDVFVPMAAESDAVLYGIVAWAGFHKDRGHHQSVGYKYLNRAMQSVVASFNKAELTTLAGLLLILAGEICNGDVVHWSKHLSLAAKIINMNGGLANFTGTKTLQWLAKNFAYHDLLAASTYAQRKTHFAAAEYDQIMKRSLGPDALLGCCQPLFQILAEISDLAVETQRMYNRLEDTYYSVTVDMLKTTRMKAAVLEQKIVSCVPDHLGMVSLTPADLEQQLTFFEVFQLTAKLHLFQSVLRLNAACLEMRCLGRELRTSLGVVLGTKVEASLVFPLFVAGLTCCLVEERDQMLDRFDRYYERQLARNIRRSRVLLEEVWKRDDHGSKYVDWNSLMETRGWDLCFA